MCWEEDIDYVFAFKERIIGVNVSETMAILFLSLIFFLAYMGHCIYIYICVC